jgi:meiotic recombination protein SPO11
MGSQKPFRRPAAIMNALCTILLSSLVQLDQRLADLTDHLDDLEDLGTAKPSSGRKRRRHQKEARVALLPMPRLRPIRIQMADRSKAIVADVKSTKFFRFPPSKSRSSTFGSQFASLARLVQLITEGLRIRTIQTKRDLYYKDVQLFQKQSTVDMLVDDLAASIGCSRFELGVVAASKGVFYGHVIVRTSHQEPLNGLAGAMLIPPCETVVEFDLTGVDYVLVVEKEVRDSETSICHAHGRTGHLSNASS